MIQYSSFQNDIFKFPADGRGDLVVNAVAGSGKTTTAVELANYIEGNARFVAFNKHIATHLNRKLAGTSMQATTIHSAGYAAVRKAVRGISVQESKYWFLMKGMEPKILRLLPRNASPVAAFMDLKKLINLARLTLTPLKDQPLASMADHYGIRYRGCYGNLIRLLIEKGDQQAEIEGVIDYTDMLWLVFRWKLNPDRFGWVFVDEAQDLSAVQRHLVLKMRAPGGRMVFVGDRNQAIMGFAGAASDSIDQIIAATNATELPLSICYRCPTSHLELAREIVPQILPAPNAEVGTIAYGDDETFDSEVAIGDFAICRRNSPLVKYCIRLIQRKIHARIQGGDFGKELVTLALMIGKQAGHYGGFMNSLRGYRSIQREKMLLRQASQTAIDALEDQIDALRLCYEGFPHVQSARELADCLADLFKDDEPDVLLSSIHRAKGLENERVWILEAGKLGQSRRNQKPHELQEEMNLKYVALTRSMGTMFMHEAAVERKAAA